MHECCSQEPILQPRKTGNADRLKRPSARSANGPPAAGSNGASSGAGLERWGSQSQWVSPHYAAHCSPVSCLVTGLTAQNFAADGGSSSCAGLPRPQISTEKENFRQAGLQDGAVMAHELSYCFGSNLLSRGCLNYRHHGRVSGGALLFILKPSTQN